MSERNVPRLRFPGFEEKWENVRIKQLIDLSSSKFNPEREDANVKSIELEHLSSGTGELLGYNQGEKLGSIKNKFKKGDILFGKLRPYLRKFLKAPFDGVCSSEIWVLQGKMVQNDFLYAMVQTETFMDLVNVSSGSKMPRSDWKVVSNGLFHIPKVSEQNKIANFVASIDTKLSQLKKKKSLLEQYKKGMMQKIFNQEIRFKDDDGKGFRDWLSVELGSISEIYQPQTISQTDLTETGYDVYGANGIIGKYNKYNHEFSQVAITCRGNTCGTVNYTKPMSWITGNAMVINFDRNAKVNKIFYYHLLSNTDFTYLITGSGQPQITGSIRRHMLVVPELAEQTKIANFLSAIDNRINLVSQQIEKVEVWKKGLLLEMFV